MTIRTIILSGLLLCGGLASGKNELSFKETVVPVKVAPDQDSITASFPFTNTSGVPVTISRRGSPARLHFTSSSTNT